MSPKLLDTVPLKSFPRNSSWRNESLSEKKSIGPVKRLPESLMETTLSFGKEESSILPVKLLLEMLIRNTLSPLPPRFLGKVPEILLSLMMSSRKFLSEASSFSMTTSLPVRLFSAVNKKEFIGLRGTKYDNRMLTSQQQEDTHGEWWPWLSFLRQDRCIQLQPTRIHVYSATLSYRRTAFQPQHHRAHRLHCNLSICFHR